MNARLLELYELLKPKLDEAPARALVLALPDEPSQLATKDDLATAFAGLESRLDVRFAQIEVRFSEIDARFVQLESLLTRRMVAILGAWTVLIGSAFAWAGVLLR